MLRRFWIDETGATAVEYGLIIAVLSLAIVSGVSAAMNAVSDLWGDNDSRLQQALQ